LTAVGPSDAAVGIAPVTHLRYGAVVTPRTGHSTCQLRAVGVAGVVFGVADAVTVRVATGRVIAFAETASVLIDGETRGTL